MVRFIWGELQWQVQDGFSILLYVEEAVQFFGEKIKLPHIAAVPQDQRCLRLILNLLAQTNKGTPSVNNTTDWEIALESTKFGRDFPRIAQTI